MSGAVSGVQAAVLRLLLPQKKGLRTPRMSPHPGLCRVGFPAQGAARPSQVLLSVSLVGAGCQPAGGRAATWHWENGGTPVPPAHVGGLPPLVTVAAFSGRTGILRLICRLGLCLTAADVRARSLPVGPFWAPWGVEQCPSAHLLDTRSTLCPADPGNHSHAQTLPPWDPRGSEHQRVAPEWPTPPFLPCFQHPTFPGLPCRC